jgi:hypothetical protein
LPEFDLKQYARRGAQIRVAELNTELAEIFRIFPDLRNGGVVDDGQARNTTQGGRRKRSRMSAAQRKAVSERMRKYWADRRRAKAAK